MNVSGILVVVPPAELDEICRDLARLPGVDVHQTDPALGRVIVTQAAESVGEEIEGLNRIKALPRVTLAEMVYHHFEDDHEIIADLPEELEGERLETVPRFLHD